jgi:hypothetical protein
MIVECLGNERKSFSGRKFVEIEHIKHIADIEHHYKPQTGKCIPSRNSLSKFKAQVTYRSSQATKFDWFIHFLLSYHEILTCGVILQIFLNVKGISIASS